MIMKKKLKLHVVCTNPDRLLREDFGCFTLLDHENSIDGWIDLGMTNITINYDEGDILNATIKAIDAEIERQKEDFAAAMELLNARKQNLLALAPPQSTDSTASPPANEES